MIDPTNLRRWRELAEAHELDAGTAHDVVPQLTAEIDRLLDLLRRVRCYAVVDPLGNPAAVAMHAARLHGIESDIDAALGRPHAAGHAALPSAVPGCGATRPVS